MGSGSDTEFAAVRGSIEGLERRLRRGRLTVPAYASAAVFFVLTAFYSGAWTPALTMAVLAAFAGWITHRLRRRWQERLAALRELEHRVEAMEGPASP